ncbi:mannose-1-phosphate guanylyltransferase [Empedobacter brevis]|uniref:mannose-1-phosphate guanylyltransferase n=1 Tax=Empedobacter brevis TaxID=247 RepID=UPI0039AF8E99
MHNKNNYAVILTSGTGVRLWPLSTIKKPKQFHDLLGIGKTFIQLTYNRLKKVVREENIFIVTIQDYKEIIKEQLPEFNDENFITEPRMMNTAACNLLAAMFIQQINPNAKLIISPSDHFIFDENEFVEKVNLAFEDADNDRLITLGVAPTRPDVNYSYIQFIENSTPIKKVKSYIDKPDLEFAQSFIMNGEFIWNTGILIWSVESIIKAFQQHLPSMKETLEKYFLLDKSLQNAETLKPIYTTLNVTSINKGILEQADNVYVIPTTFGWSDIGTWSAVNEKYKYTGEDQDENHNTLLCKHFSGYNASNNFIYSTQDKAIIIDGLEDYVVINSEKGLLICPRSNVRFIKTYVSDLKLQKNGEKYC